MHCHANVRLTPRRRAHVFRAVEAGMTVSAARLAFRVSRCCSHHWLSRWRASRHQRLREALAARQRHQRLGGQHLGARFGATAGAAAGRRSSRRPGRVPRPPTSGGEPCLSEAPARRPPAGPVACVARHRAGKPDTQTAGHGDPAAGRPNPSQRAAASRRRPKLSSRRRSGGCGSPSSHSRSGSGRPCTPGRSRWSASPTPPRRPSSHRSGTRTDWFAYTARST